MVFRAPKLPVKGSVTAVLLMLLGATCLEPAPVAPVEPAAVEEYRAKAALLYVFAKFVAWPEDAFTDEDAPFVFGLVGPHSFGPALDEMRDKRIHGRRVVTRYFSSIGKFEPCHILFCTREDLNQFALQRPGALDSTHVLTVGEEPGFAESGGILHLTFVDNHLAYRINIDAVRRARIEVSAKLFELASAVVTEPK